MANVLGYAAGWEGFIAAMGLTPGSLALSNMTAAAGFAQANKIDIACKLPAAMTWNFPQQLKLFTSLLFEQTNVYVASAGSSGIRGYTHKLLCFYNSAGALVFSIGYLPAAYTSSTSSVNSTRADTLQIFFYGADQVTPTSTIILGNFPVKASGTTSPYNSFAPSASLKVATDLAAVGSAIAIEVVINGLTVTIPASSIQASVKNIVKVTVGEFTSNSANASYLNLPLNNIVFADDADHTLQAGVVRPVALTANNQFSGAVTDINSTSQDTTFMASSSEVAAVLECTIAQLQQLSTSKVESISLYMMARYVQAGGTSVSFTCMLVNPSGGIHSSAVVTVAANEDYNYWRTNPVLVAINNLLTASKFTYAELAAMYIRIAI